MAHVLMTDRRKAILKAIIRLYTKDAQPVGSKNLAERFNFGIGPAMIRQEMMILEKEGYLTQPHTSAGRIPTDMAYRLYISELAESPDELSLKEQKRISNEVGRTHDDWHELFKEVSRIVSDISGELSVAGLASGEAHYMHGFSQLAQEPELQDRHSIDNLFRFMDEMDQYFDHLWSSLLSNSYGVFIGSENPIKEIRSFSVVTGRYTLPKGEAGFISIIGPKRMDYRKNVALVRYVSHALARGN